MEKLKLLTAEFTSINQYNLHQVFNLVGYVIMQNLWMLYLKTNKTRYLIRSGVLPPYPMRRKVTGCRNGPREELRGPEDK